MAAPVLKFEGIGLCFYELDSVRPPRCREYYLSGAIVEAWRAFSDLATPYQVVRPTHYAIEFTAYRPGEKVRFTSTGFALPRDKQEF